jgi:hypothetical protein
MTSLDPTDPQPPDLGEPHPITHPDRPLIDDQSAAVIEDAAVELAWLPLVVVASARKQRHTRAEIAAVADLDRPWELNDPGRDRTPMPYNDADTVKAIDQAATTVILSRAPGWLGDPGPTISVLVSLVYEAESRLDDAVADARDHGYSWDQIADRLGTSVTTARRRYAWWAHHSDELPTGQPAPPATKPATSPPRTPATPRPARPARQLNITPAAARRHYRAHIASTPAAVD